jgi:hypothetical protein
MKASDNAYPSVLLLDGSPPATPPTGRLRLYVQSGTLQLIDSTGAVVSPGEVSAADLAAVQAEVDAVEVAVAGKAASVHTHVSTSITDLLESVQDIIAATLVGSGVTVSYNDTAGTVTITGLASTDAEAVRDAIGIAMVGVGAISVSVDDTADTITISTTATVNSSDAALRDRSTHTGTQASSSIVDLTETVQDLVAAMVTDSATVTKAYDDSAGTLTLTAVGGGGGGATPAVPYIFTDARDPLTTGTGTLKLPNATGRTLTLKPVRVDVSTAPTGAALIVDVHKNGTTIFTTQSKRPQVAAGSLFDLSDTPDVTSWADGETLTIDIDQVGSSVAGAGATITIIAEG